MQDAYIPTRDHPHRWCRDLHRFAFAAYLPTALVLLLGDPLLMLFAVGVVIATVMIMPRLLTGKTISDIVDEESEDDGNIPTSPLWLRLAVATDIAIAVFELYLFWVTIQALSAPPSKSASTAGPGYLLIPVAIIVVGTSLQFYSHYRATRPRLR